MIQFPAYTKYHPQYRKYNVVEKARVLELALAQYRKLLDLPKDLAVTIKPIKWGKKFHTWGKYYGSTRHAVIDLKIPITSAVEILGHELVHAEQFKTGRLMMKFTSDCVWASFWEGRRVYEKDFEYVNLPWEKEAYARQKPLAAKAMMMTAAEIAG